MGPMETVSGVQLVLRQTRGPHVNGVVAVESVENRGTRFKQTFRAFIPTTSAGWLRDFTLYAKTLFKKGADTSTTSYPRPLQGYNYNPMH